MLPKKRIFNIGLRCHKCTNAIPKGEKMLFFAKGAYHGTLDTGQMCQKCTMKLFAEVFDYKYLTKKAKEYIVSEEI